MVQPLASSVGASAPTSEPIIVDNVVKRFGSVVALNGVTLTAGRERPHFRLRILRIANDDTFCFALEDFDKACVYGLLDVETRPSNAALPAGRKYAGDDRV